MARGIWSLVGLTASLLSMPSCSDHKAADPTGGAQTGGASTSTGASVSTGASANTSGGSAAATGASGGANSAANDTGVIITPTTGGDANTSNSTGPSDAGCGGTDVGATSDVDALLVIDRSLSMSFMPAGFGTDKWTALGMALPPALEAVADKLSLGLEFFGSPDSGDSCAVNMGDSAVQVPVAPGTTSVPLIEQQLMQTKPTSSTPTAAALRAALDYFTTGAGSALTGTKYVILATDGGPNCNRDLTCTADQCTPNLDGADRCPAPPTDTNCCAAGGGRNGPTGCLDDARANGLVKQLADGGVKTIVIGIPGSEGYAQILDGFAQAGGAPNPHAPPSYYAVDANSGVQGLEQVLSDITRSLIMDCQFKLTSVPQDNGLVSVFVDGSAIVKGTDWDLDTSSSPPTVVLKGDVCNSVMTSGAEKVQVRYGCRPRVN